MEWEETTSEKIYTRLCHDQPFVIGRRKEMGRNKARRKVVAHDSPFTTRLEKLVYVDVFFESFRVPTFYQAARTFSACDPLKRENYLDKFHFIKFRHSCAS
jgi:hypothetical protein